MAAGRRKQHRAIVLTAIAFVSCFGTIPGAEAQVQEPVPPWFRRAVPGRRGAPVQVLPNTFWCAAFSPDGRSIAAVGGSQQSPGKLIVWDLPGNQVKYQHDEAKGIRSLAYAPDGKTLALALYDGKVRLIDASTGKEKQVLQGHKNGVNCVAFSPDGQTLASASLDQTAKLWDLKSGKEKMTLRGHTEYVLCVAFSPDGRTLGTCSGTSTHPQTGGNAKLWDVSTGKDKATLPSPQMPIEYLAFSPDGRTVATASWDGSVKLWDAESGNPTGSIAAHVQGGFAVQFSQDGKMLATAGGTNQGPGGVVKLLEVPSGKEIAALPHPSNVWSVQFSPDGRTLAVACWDNTVKLWELATRKERAVLTIAPPGQPVTASAGSPDAKSLSREQLYNLWTDLGNGDAPRAYRALWSLVESGKPAVQLMEEQIPGLFEDKPVSIDLSRTAALIAQLDDDQVTVREKATAELKNLGKAAEPAMRQALEQAPSAEVDYRLKLLLSNLSGEAPRNIHLIRAIEVLENQGTGEARALLDQLAGKKSKEPLASEARAALERLNQRNSKNRG
jgi:dipeptidyl aminopeptidase/acylaminoacyl peptidase